MSDASIANLKNANILIVDDQPANVALLETLLEREGYANVRSTTDSQQALALFHQFGAELILLDLHMPGLDGHELLRRIRASQPAHVYLPILVLTADITSEAKTNALIQGATDFLVKPLDLVEVALRIRNMLETRYLYGQLHQQNQDLEKLVEARTADLTQANRQLRAEIAERERTERKYRSLVEHLPIITYIVEFGARNQISYISPQVEEIFGFGATDWETDPDFWDKRIHPDDLADVTAALQNADAVGEAANLEFRMTARDGRVVWVHGWSVPVADEAGIFRYAHGILEDITERKHAEVQLRQSEERFSKIFKSSPAGITLTTLSEGRMIDANDSLLKMTGQTREALIGQRVQDLGFQIDPGVFEQVGELLQTRHTIQGLELNFINALGQTVELMAALEVVELQDQPYLLTMYQDISELKKREAELGAIAAVSAALRKAQTRAEMLPVVLDQVLSLLKAEGALLVVRDSPDQVRIELGLGLWAPLTGTVMATGEGQSGRVLTTGEPYRNDAIEADPQFYARARADRIKAAACVPLIANQQTVGAIWMGRQAPISASDMRLFTAVADMAANAIYRASLHERTEQQLQRLNILRAVDQAITGSFDLRLVLNVLLDQITSQLSVQAADFLLLSPNTLTLEFAAGHGFRSRLIEQSRVRVGEGFSGRVALERHPIHIPSITAMGTQFRRAALIANEGFQSYYAVPAIAKGQIKGVLELFSSTTIKPDPEWESFVEALASQTAIAVDNNQLFEGLQRSNFDLALAYDATLEGWSRALDLRDKETEGHSQRVTEMTVQLAQAVGLKAETLVHIRRGALLHDIGKLGVPDSILLKPDKLTDEEWLIMKKHPTQAYEMLLPIAYLRPALDIPYCHHEKWDGSGYPRGLTGENIPLAARLFAVVDVWDALNSDRPYRPGWAPARVRDYIRSESGKHFDPQVVEAFLKIIDNLRPATA